MSSPVTFKRPKFIDGVRYSREENSFLIRLLDTKFNLDLESEALANAVSEILERLTEGHDYEQLIESFDRRLQPYSVDILLSLLDGQNVLTELPAHGTGKFGSSLYREVRAHFKSRLVPLFADEEGPQRFHDLQLSREELKAWTVEYYFTTRAAEQCIIAASNQRSNPVLQRLMQDFFIDEVGHDKLLERSLLGFGLRQDELEALTPHISTVAVMGLLLQAALFDVPLFITLVGQMEGSEAQSRRYIQLLERSGLPEAAIRPQISHEMINIENDHFGEALEMASALAHVSADDIERCTRMLHLHLEMRTTVYSHIFPTAKTSRTITPALFQEVWRNFGRNIRKTILPIAVSNSEEHAGKQFARDFVELRKVELLQWDPAQKSHVAGALLEYALWKLAYQEPERIGGTLRWLDAVVEGREVQRDNVPAYIVQAFTEHSQAVLVD